MPALPRRWGCKRRCPEAFLNDQVTRAQDRFAAGVVSNIEVVQAQDAVAVATE
jgi:outer membrane protein TolC